MSLFSEKFACCGIFPSDQGRERIGRTHRLGGERTGGVRKEGRQQPRGPGGGKVSKSSSDSGQSLNGAHNNGKLAKGVSFSDGKVVASTPVLGRSNPGVVQKNDSNYFPPSETGGQPLSTSYPAFTPLYMGGAPVSSGGTTPVRFHSHSTASGPFGSTPMSNGSGPMGPMSFPNATNLMNPIMQSPLPTIGLGGDGMGPWKDLYQNGQIDQHLLIKESERRKQEIDETVESHMKQYEEHFEKIKDNISNQAEYDKMMYMQEIDNKRGQTVQHLAQQAEVHIQSFLTQALQEKGIIENEVSKVLQREERMQPMQSPVHPMQMQTAWKNSERVFYDQAQKQPVPYPFHGTHVPAESENPFHSGVHYPFHGTHVPAESENPFHSGVHGFLATQDTRSPIPRPPSDPVAATMLSHSIPVASPFWRHEGSVMHEHARVSQQLSSGFAEYDSLPGDTVETETFTPTASRQESKSRAANSENNYTDMDGPLQPGMQPGNYNNYPMDVPYSMLPGYNPQQQQPAYYPPDGSFNGYPPGSSHCDPRLLESVSHSEMPHARNTQPSYDPRLMKSISHTDPLVATVGPQYDGRSMGSIPHADSYSAMHMYANGVAPAQYDSQTIGSQSDAFGHMMPPEFGTPYHDHLRINPY